MERMRKAKEIDTKNYTDEEIFDLPAEALNQPEFEDFESFKEYLLEQIEEAEREIEEGRGIPMEAAFAEMEGNLRNYGCI